MKRRRGLGFTLVELMIGSALGSIMMAGVFEMFVVFSRSAVQGEQVGEMQQVLRAATELIARSARGAGAGFGGGVLSVFDCGAGVLKVYAGVTFSNLNQYAEPVLGDNVSGDAETGDPDWLRVGAMSADGRIMMSGVAGANAISVSDVTGVKVGDWVYVYSGDTGPDLTKHILHGRLVTGVAPSGVGAGGTITYCFGGNDTNMAAVMLPGAVYRRDSWTTWRIDTTDPKTPRLLASFARPWAAPAWQVMSENIEDLQIALILNNGTECGRQGYSVDVPALCPPSQVRAVRFTLVSRSSSPVVGFTLGRAGGYEDETPAPVTDGFLRRAVTVEAQLRNGGGL